MKRINEKDLEAVVSRLNRITNSPMESYSKNPIGSGIKAQIGNYHLSWAYGGVSLHRMHNEQGGVTTPLNCGYVSNRELYNLMQAYISGILSNQEIE